MAKDACLTCGKPLPANKELASVPNGRLVAFDPDANRVWRICEECNHWELLGPQAARVAVPELQGRYDAELAASGGQMAMAVISRKLLLFRVGAPASNTATELFASELHAGLGKGITWQFGAFVVLFLAAIFGAMAWLDRFATWEAIFDSKAPMLVFYTSMVAQGVLGGRESTRGRPAWLRWLWLVVLPLVFNQFVESPMPIWGRILCVAGGLAMGVWIGRSEGKPRGVRWAEGGEVMTYHDGAHGDQQGWAATTCLLFELTAESMDRVKAEDRALAWALWQAHHSLPGLLESLAERRDADGLLRLSSLTKAERMALLIATGARMAEPPAEVIAGLAEAERVAAIAESLDREITLPTPPAPSSPTLPA
ncbi:MAG: hypothetical protein V9E87_15565 [Gemmatimonadales bacterium]